VVAGCLVEAWRRHGGGDAPRVLDFGCGPGRVTAPFKRLLPASRLHGSDIDREAIDWARANLGAIAAFASNAAVPPLPRADGSFDLVYAVSVFTHLDEPSQLRWLAELARILVPDGWLIATVHGALAQASCSPRELERLGAGGFWYRIGRRGRFKLDGLPDSYQTTFHTRDYIERRWQGDFELAQYLEGGIAGHQDLVVLRRRSNASAHVAHGASGTRTDGYQIERPPGPGTQ
jgi:SAM-dependent methyltransferase